MISFVETFVVVMESESLNQFFRKVCSLISVVKPNTLYSVNIRKSSFQNKYQKF